MSPSSEFSIVKIPPPDSHTLWENERFGIRADKEFARYESRSNMSKVFDYMSVCFHALKYTMEAGYKRLDSMINTKQISEFDDNESIGKTGSIALVILFHGLHGQSSVWDNHIDQLKDYHEIDVLTPEIPEAGQSDIDSEPFSCLLNRIIDWTKRNPLKPIVLFGQSNGSRVATHYEILLREKAPSTPVLVSLTAAVLFGSVMINTFKFDSLYSLISDKYNIYDDLNYGSEKSKNLIDEVRKPIKDHVAPRHYSMYAPYHDHHVHSLGSALPIINPDKQSGKTEDHYVIYGYGHNAAPTGIFPIQIDECINWIKKMQ
jgi:pimeloyl-ACP methyl ester carboxylesterase